MGVDSAVVFAQRCEDFGLSEFKAKWAAKSWTTFGIVAFVCPQTAPGVADEAVFRKTIVEPITVCGAEAELPPVTAGLLRLWYESHIMYMGDMRRRRERTEDDTPRRLPQPDREAMKAKLKEKLATINRCVAMLEDNTVEWIPPEHCPPRSRELAAGPPKKRWLPDTQGIVKDEG